MRHTLIPTELRKSLRHEYRVRTGIVLLFMLSLAGTIGIVSLLPAFIHATSEKNSAEQNLALLQSRNSEASTTVGSAELAAQTNTLALFNDGSGAGIDYGKVIGSIVDARGAVTITSLVISDISTTTTTTNVQGVAPTRDALLSFKSRLQSIAEGGKVDLPVSQLAKSNDVQYSLSVTIDSTK